MKATIPSLTTIFSIICILLGITVKCFELIAVAIVLLLLVLPALCYQIHEMTPAAKREHDKRMKELDAALNCVGDLAALSKNKTDENIAQFKSRWPNFVQQITSNPIACKMTYDIGVWKLFNELTTKENEK